VIRLYDVWRCGIDIQAEFDVSFVGSVEVKMVEVPSGPPAA
jgi:hypothetical protein